MRSNRHRIRNIQVLPSGIDPAEWFDWHEAGEPISAGHVVDGRQFRQQARADPSPGGKLSIGFFSRDNSFRFHPQDMFGESEERSISYTLDYMQVALRIKVSDGRSGFMINIGLGYHSNEILPFQVDFEVEGK